MKKSELKQLIDEVKSDILKEEYDEYDSFTVKVVRTGLDKDGKARGDIILVSPHSMPSAQKFDILISDLRKTFYKLHDICKKEIKNL